jgi:hypothetical protein
METVLHSNATANTAVNNDNDSFSKSTLKAGTGYMLGLSETIRNFQNEGYIENLVPSFNHFGCRSGKFRLFPEDFNVEKMFRFENSSDPDDQAILYVISSRTPMIKGLYVDSYGAYHDELSNEMLSGLMECPRP